MILSSGAGESNGLMCRVSKLTVKKGAMVMEERPQIRVMYANAAQVNIGRFDAVLDFGLKADRIRKEVAPEDFQVELVMSVDFLRAVRELIDKALETFDTTIAKESDRLEVVAAKNEQ